METLGPHKPYPLATSSPHRVPSGRPNPFVTNTEPERGLLPVLVSQQDSHAFLDSIRQGLMATQASSSAHREQQTQTSAFSRWQPSTSAPQEAMQDADGAESCEVSCSASDSAVMSDEALRIAERKLHTEPRPANSVPAPQCVRPRPIRPVAGSGPPYARPELPQARAVLHSVPVLQAADLVQQTVAAHYPRPWPSQDMPTPSSPFMLSMSEARPMAGMRSDAASASSAVREGQHDPAAQQARAAMPGKQRAYLRRRPSKRFKPATVPPPSCPEHASQNLEELAAMANEVVRQNSRQRFLRRPEGITASLSHSPASSGEPVARLQQQAGSAGVPLPPDARSAGPTSRPAAASGQRATPAQTEPSPEDAMNLRRQHMAASDAAQPALGAVDRLLQALIAKASQAKGKRAKPASEHSEHQQKAPSDHLDSSGDLDEAQVAHGILQASHRPTHGTGLNEQGADSAGQRILAILLKMSAIRRKGQEGKAGELQAYTAELQRLCNDPAAASQAMKLLKQVNDYSSNRAAFTSTAAITGDASHAEHPNPAQLTK